VTGAAESPVPMSVALSSFGFKFGLPPESEVMADARMVRNPFWVAELRPLTGLEPTVRDYVLEDPVAGELMDHVCELVTWSTARLTGRGRDVLHVSIGCTGGRHRSVAIVEAVAARLRANGLVVTVSHRDVDQPDPRYE
jgi:RNase adapter protein RapZ